MFIETTMKNAASVTWYIINTIVLVFCLRGKQCNVDKYNYVKTFYYYCY